MEKLNEIIKWFDESFTDVDFENAGVFEVNELDRALRVRHREINKIIWEYKNDFASLEEFDIEETISNLTEATELQERVRRQLEELARHKESKRQLYIQRRDRRNEIASEINTNNEVIGNLESTISLLEEKNSNPTLVETLKLQIEELRKRNDECIKDIEILEEEMDIIVHGGKLSQITLSEDEKKELNETEVEQEELEENEDIEEEITFEKSMRPEENTDNRTKSDDAKIETEFPLDELDDMLDQEAIDFPEDKTKNNEAKTEAKLPLDELDDILDQEAIDFSENMGGAKDTDNATSSDGDSTSDGEEKKDSETSQTQSTPEEEQLPEPLPEPTPELADEEPNLENPLNHTPPETPVIPVVKGNKPKVTWKTIAAIASGVAIGATVFFTAGPVGVAVMTVAGTIGKKIINNQRLRLARLGSEVAIEKIEEPRPGIRGKFDKVKKYLKSDEGLRDMSSLLGAAIITGNVLNIASAIHNTVIANAPTPETLPLEPEIAPTPESIPVEPQINPTPEVLPVEPTPIEPTPIVDTIPTPEITPYDNIVIGENVGSYNVSVGHDTAAWAVNGTNTETLLSQYVNGDSVFKSFASINPNGTVGQIINTDGLSITEFCAQNGLDINSVAVDVARGSDNASQAWVSASELIKGVGGPTI